MDDWRRDTREALGVAVRLDEPLARHTTMRVGGPVDAWVEVENEEQLSRVLEFCGRSALEWWVIGRGSNLLVSDQGLRGVAIRLGGEFEAIGRTPDAGRQAPDASGVSVTVGAGASMDALAEWAELHGLGGAEFLAGIPGTVGGGLRSNAGAFGRSLADIVISVSGLDGEARNWTLGRDGLTVGYRQPLIGDGLIATRVVMRLLPQSAGSVRRTREERRARHPSEPSAGSFFKNPERTRGFGDSEMQGEEGERIPAGKLIEECGLVGRTVGGARVSEKHANFIVNTGGARFSDVLELAQVVKATVEQETGIELMEEVQMLPGPRK